MIPPPDPQLQTEILEELNRLMNDLIAAGRSTYDSWLDKELAVRDAREALLSRVRTLVEEARKEGEQNMVRRARAGALL